MKSENPSLFYLAQCAIYNQTLIISHELHIARAAKPQDQGLVEDLQRKSFELFLHRRALSTSDQEGLLNAVRTYSTFPLLAEKAIQEALRFDASAARGNETSG
ncbi:hypothetical protein [Pseudoxanthomonas mexicana]|uniref:hypothetical protein n=1 Tax=Pseudoxanthomonas mexicana TaxID=128785 RepID=UPI0028A96C97|nr:hypothetical protein [Pseudoxanthomonas mexicana]